MADIKTVFVELNPWWQKPGPIEFKDREIYGAIRKYVKLPQIIALTGLRRVGKTTLMMKMAADAIGEGADPRRVVYFSFDEFRNAEIRSLVKTYEEISEKSLDDGKCLLLLDEIQKLDGWEEQLKGFYDTHKDRVKIVISGSESLFLRKMAKETLAGRVFEFKVDPLCFKEFLAFHGAEWKPIGLHEKELVKWLGRFILTLGFPELAHIDDRDVIRKYIKEGLIEKIIYRDIPGLFRIRGLSILESILNIIMDEPGQLIDISSLAKEQKISRQTASAYLSYLEQSFLVKKLYNYSRNRRKTERKLKKYYPTVVSTGLLFKDDDHSRSKVFEWFIVNQLKSEFFWRDPYKNEVDIVKAEEQPLAIEIKYGKIDIRGLLTFMKKFGVSEGHIVSWDREDTIKSDGNTIHIIPAYKYLLR